MMTTLQTVGWLPLVACPDCGGSMEPASDAPPRCNACRRTFEAAAAGLNLLPAGEEIRTSPRAARNRLRQYFVGAVYVPHESATIRRALTRVFAALGPNDWGVNLGAAETKLHPRLLNLDIDAAPEVDVVATAYRLPFRDGSLACVVSQETFEHLADPDLAAREAARVLRPGGLFYLQTPFIIGFHSGPNDYWRFTHQGLAEILSAAGLELIETGASAGAGRALFRITVEFAATLAASLWRRLYYPAKAAAAVVCTPLRWADAIVGQPGEFNRISAGFYAIARKPG